MFSKESRASNNNKKQARYAEAAVFPVLGAEQLLSSKKHQLALKAIKKLSNVGDEHFQQLYEPLIRNFVEFVQAVPTDVGGKMGGLLNDGLERGRLALKLHQDNDLYADDPMFSYATFSAALVADIHLLMENRRIMICDDLGIVKAPWLPFGGPMPKDKFYKIRSSSRIGALSRYGVSLLARQLMPKDGFLWISSDPHIFNMWLWTLTGDESGGGGLGHTLTLVKVRLAHELEQGEVLPEIAIEAKYPPDSAMAEAFLRWLKEGIADQAISVNQPDSFVHVLEGGNVLLTTPLAFEEFGQHSKQYEQWRVAQAQFNYLGLTRLSGDHHSIAQYFGEYPEMISRELAESTSKKDKRAPSNKPFLQSMRLGLQQASVTKATAPTAKLQEGIIIREGDVVFDNSMPTINKYITVNLAAAEHVRSLPKIPHDIAHQMDVEPVRKG